MPNPKSKIQNPKSKTVATNRRASHDYELLERFEAGLVLMGTEIKAIRAHQVNLQRSFVENRDGELWLVEAHIAPYEHGRRDGHDPDRPRKLLLHRREINKIISKLAEKGLTVVPTRLYLSDGRAKVEIALARGKKQYDKRAALAKKEADRQVERALRKKYGYDE
ncbi:MAG: SsrA-binding protein SmpB [Chloroflexota bacterium]